MTDTGVGENDLDISVVIGHVEPICRMRALQRAMSLVFMDAWWKMKALSHKSQNFTKLSNLLRSKLSSTNPSH